MRFNSITADAVVYHCAGCGAALSAPTAALLLGDGHSPDVIRFPPCACGACLFALRTWDAAPKEIAGSPADELRRAVNALAQHLLAAGRSHPDHAKAHANEAATPPDLDVFPLDLAARRAEHAAVERKRTAAALRNLAEQADEKAKAARAAADALAPVEKRRAFDESRAAHDAAQQQHLARRAEAERLAREASEAAVVAKLARLTPGADVAAADALAVQASQAAQLAAAQSAMAFHATTEAHAAARTAAQALDEAAKAVKVAAGQIAAALLAEQSAVDAEKAAG